MLRRETVRPELQGVLDRLVDLPALKSFFLVGGTALALKLGHRISVDIDLFTSEEIDFENLKKEIVKLSNCDVYSVNKGGMNAMIEDVKVDFVRHNYPILRPLEKIEGITFLSNYDIAIQKIHAIVRRGAKKDFYDFFYLLKEFSLEELVDGYQEKYGSLSPVFVKKSLVWFDDAEQETDPMVFNELSWADVKSSIENAVYGNNKTEF